MAACVGELEGDMVNIGSLPKLVLGVMITVVVYRWHQQLDASGETLAKMLFFVMIASALLALVGLLEIVTNRPFGDLSDAWQRMSKPAQALLGTLVLALLSLAGIVALYLFLPPR
jgi:uncharacterized BrkB/YihY/UPF0761 family membrane protein